MSETLSADGPIEQVTSATPILLAVIVCIHCVEALVLFLVRIWPRFRSVPKLPQHFEYLLDLLIVEAAMVISLQLTKYLLVSTGLTSDMWQCLRGLQSFAFTFFAVFCVDLLFTGFLLSTICDSFTFSTRSYYFEITRYLLGLTLSLFVPNFLCGLVEAKESPVVCRMRDDTMQNHFGIIVKSLSIIMCLHFLHHYDCCRRRDALRGVHVINRCLVRLVYGRLVVNAAILAAIASVSFGEHHDFKALCFHILVHLKMHLNFLLVAEFRPKLCRRKKKKASVKKILNNPSNSPPTSPRSRTSIPSPYRSPKTSIHPSPHRSPLSSSLITASPSVHGGGLDHSPYQSVPSPSSSYPNHSPYRSPFRSSFTPNHSAHSPSSHPSQSPYRSPFRNSFTPNHSPRPPPGHSSKSPHRSPYRNSLTQKSTYPSQSPYRSPFHHAITSTKCSPHSPGEVERPRPSPGSRKAGSLHRASGEECLEDRRSLTGTWSGLDKRRGSGSGFSTATAAAGWWKSPVGLSPGRTSVNIGIYCGERPITRHLLKKPSSVGV